MPGFRNTLASFALLAAAIGIATAGYLALDADAAAPEFASAPPASSAARATQFTLKNGLQLVVIPDHRAPVVTHMVWYHVGGTDDPPGLSGEAHLFEHLMFKGTKEVPNGELSKLIARNGGQDNAQTSHDFTVYFQRIAKDRLPIVMGLEADRMVNLDLSEPNVTTERDVVLEERHLRIDSEPQALAQEQMEAALQLSHPYGRPVIGWEKEIRSIGRAQAIDFYQHHYAPNNAIVMVVGDVTPDDVRKIAEEKYGSVPSRELAPRVDEPAPPRLAETRINFALVGTKLPQLLRMYRVPGYVKAPKGTAEAMEVMSAILGNGATSRLYKTLVVDKKLAVEAGAAYDGHNRGPGTFVVFAVPRDGISFNTLETAMDQVIAGLMRANPEDGEFNRAKTQLIANYTYQHDNQYLMAQDYGTALSIGLTIQDVEDWPNRIRAVTTSDVRKVAQTYLVKEEAVTGRMSPKAGP
jgi:zinc protease